MSGTLRLRRHSAITDLGEAAEAPPAAPHASRLLAWVLDFVLVMLVAAAASEPFPLAIPVALFVVYHTLAVWLTGQTIGKAIFGLRVVRRGGARTLSWSLGRATIGYFGCSLLGLGLLVAFRDGRHRCLHDVILGSQVVIVDRGRLNVRRALVRLSNFAQMREEEANKRQAALGVAVLGLLWNWLHSLASGVVGALDWLGGLFGGSGSGRGRSTLAALGGESKVVLAAAATGVTTAAVAFVPPVADGARWLFEPRYYVSAPSEQKGDADTPSGLATPEAAIAAFARDEGWRGRGWNYEGDCADAVTGRPRALLCSEPLRGSPDDRMRELLAPGERVFVIAPGWSDVHHAILALKHSDGRWAVTRELKRTQTGP